MQYAEIEEILQKSPTHDLRGAELITFAVDPKNHTIAAFVFKGADGELTGLVMDSNCFDQLIYSLELGKPINRKVTGPFPHDL